MTMLDRMRRHRSWLKWSLLLVCLAFVIFYIPDFLRGTGADAASDGTVASIEGQDISAGEFRRIYQAQLQAYRSAYGGQMNDQLLKQLGVEQQILQQMVDERAALAEAEKLKIRVSDEEVRQRILTIPAFQDNGQFIGEQRYTQLLRSQRPPLTGAEFEENIRRQLTVEKLRASLTDWISVPEQELEQEYRRRNDKVKLAVVSLTADSFRAQVTASDAEVVELLRRAQGRLQDRRETEDPVSARRHGGPQSEDRGAPGRHRARLQQQHRAVLDARAGARQPHPAEDRRQGRRRRSRRGPRIC